MLTTYEEIFNRIAAKGKQIDDEFYTCEEELFIKTPTGYVPIRGAHKKKGVGIKLKMDSGHEIHVEERHTVMTDSGWQFAKDATNIKHESGEYRQVVSKEKTDATEFFDINIDYPHAYYDPDGFVHHNTFSIMQVIEQNNLLKNKDYVKLSGKASPIEIYKTLFMYRDGGLIVFDDLDSMWRNEDATNILKAALDSSPVREISWVSTQTINVSRMPDDKKQELFKMIDKQIDGTDEDIDDFLGDDEEDGKESKKPKKRIADTKIRYPSTFDFRGRVIFISNLKPEEMDSAILSRSTKINMDMTPEQILMRMRSILPKLGGTDVPLDKKEELLNQLIAMHGRKEITAVTMREFTKGLDIVRSGAPNWRDLLIYS